MSTLHISTPPHDLDFDLPSVRQITLELMALLNSEDTSLKDIIATIKLDPALTGRLLSYANSPFLAPLSTITDLEQAIVRIGRNDLKTIFYRTVMRDAFATTDPRLDALMRPIWTHSLAASVALDKLMPIMRSHLELDEEEQNFISTLGIMHNIGFLVLQHNFPQAFFDLFHASPPLSLDTFQEAEHAAFAGLDHGLAGKYVLDHWYFPHFLSDIVLNLFPSPHPASDLLSLIRLSNHLAMHAGLSFYPSVPATFWIDALPQSWELDAAMNLAPCIAQEAKTYLTLLNQP
ncbi:hypothetical protein MASR1M90_12300 [Desulfovibrionales bacterium]